MIPHDRSERSEEHTSELQSHDNLVCRLLLEKKATAPAPDPAPPPRSSTPPRHSQPRESRFRFRTGARRAVMWTLSKARGPEAFFFNDTAATEIYTRSLHDALPI